MTRDEKKELGEHHRLQRALPRMRRSRAATARQRQGGGSAEACSSHCRTSATSPSAATAAHVYTECARIWNPIHTDVAYARAAGLPDIILHGTATLALSISKVSRRFVRNEPGAAAFAAASPAWSPCRARSRCTRPAIGDSAGFRDPQRARRGGHRTRLDRLNSDRTSFMLRSTKIVATLGPGLQRAGGARAHGARRRRRGAARTSRTAPPTTTSSAPRWCKEICRKVGRTVGIMCDLQGPKIRVGKFKDGKVTLEKGERFILDAGSRSATASAPASTTRSCRATSRPGAVLLLDDGKIVLDVTERARQRGAHHGAPRRRAVQQQGHQPPGRRPDRAGAHRQGHGGHPDRGEDARPTTSRCRSRRAAPTCTWRAS